MPVVKHSRAHALPGWVAAATRKHAASGATAAGAAVRSPCTRPSHTGPTLAFHAAPSSGFFSSAAWGMGAASWPATCARCARGMRACVHANACACARVCVRAHLDLVVQELWQRRQGRVQIIGLLETLQRVTTATGQVSDAAPACPPSLGGARPAALSCLGPLTMSPSTMARRDLISTHASDSSGGSLWNTTNCTSPFCGVCATAKRR